MPSSVYTPGLQKWTIVGMDNVSTPISDLWFNTNHSCEGLDSSEMRDSAQDFLDSLRQLGVNRLPSIDALIRDFEDRL